MDVFKGDSCHHLLAACCWIAYAVHSSQPMVVRMGQRERDFAALSHSDDAKQWNKQIQTYPWASEAGTIRPTTM